MRAFWDSHIERNGVDGLPTTHNVTITYEDTSGHPYGPEKSVIDLDAMRGTLYTNVKTIHDIGQTLDKLHDVLKSSSVLGSRGSLEVEAVIEEWDQHQARADLETYEAMCRDLQVTKRLQPASPQIATLETAIAEWRGEHPEAPPTDSSTDGSTPADARQGTLT